MRTVIEEFWNLHEEHVSIMKDPSKLGSESHDSLLRLLTHVKNNPECRDALAGCFVTLIEGLREVHSSASYGWRVIPFCMRELRWQEVKDAITKELQDAVDPDHHRFLKRILSAYEPAWEDESAFLYYVEKAEKDGRVLSFDSPKSRRTGRFLGILKK